MRKVELSAVTISYRQDSELVNGVKVINTQSTWNSPKGLSIPVWQLFSQRLNNISFLTKKFICVSPPVILKIRSRSPKSNQLLSLSQ